MVEYERRDLVCLHLDAHAEASGQSPAPPAVTAAGIGDALGLGDTAAGRIRLLDVLAALREDDLVVAEERPIVGHDAPRTVYFLTGTGREHALALRDRLRTETVEITNGTTEEIPLDEIDRYFEDADAPLVTALTRLTDDGRLPLEQHVGERFVDRGEALAAVREGIEASFNRESQTIAVGGAAGMGKTALVREAISRVADERGGIREARGDCRPGATAPYGPLRQAFERLPTGGDLLALLDDARAGATPDGPERIDTQRTVLFNQIADGLREAATDRPVVVFLDNLQWADEATLELFAHLATAIDELLYPVAFVGAYRETVVAATDGHPLPGILDRIERAGAYTEVRLGALSRGDTRALLADVLGRQHLPEPFVELVYEQTGGNPLFVRETATHLLETGRVDPGGDRYPTSPDEVVLPREVTEQIDRRLSALDGPSLELLRLGAVLGERIPGRVLAEASDLAPARRREYVDVLTSSRLWEPVDGDASVASDAGSDDGVAADGSGDFRFVSAGVQEAVVERLPEGLGGRYHGRIAEAFTEVYGEDLDERAARVAYHYDRAGEADAAVEYYRRAGDYAKDTYANEEAIEHYERALELAADADGIDGTELAGLRAGMADVYKTVGAYDRAIETAEEGLSAAPEGSRERCRLLGIVTAGRYRQGEYEQARETAGRQRELAADLGARDLEAEAIRYLGNVAWFQSEYDRAREYFERSLGIFRDVGDRRGETLSLHNLGLVAEAQGEYDRAREYFERSLEIFRELGHRHGEASSLNILGAVAQDRGEYDRAREYLERSIDIAREIGDRRGEISGLHNLGEVAQRRGEYDRAREHLRESLETAREVGDRRGEALGLFNLGVIAQRRGEYDRAREHLRESLDIARDLGIRQYEARSLTHLGEVARRRGEYGRADEHVEEALETFDAIDDRVGLAECRLAAGRLALARGEVDAARRRAEQAREAFEEQGARHWVGRSRQLLGEVAAGAGSSGESREHWRAALEAFEAVGAPQDALATLEHLVEACREHADDGEALEWCRRARSVLADAPEEVADRHRGWVDRHASELEEPRE